MRRILGSYVLATLTVLGLAGAPARAQVMVDRVPADAIIYAGWAGTDTLGPAYDASHLKGFLEALNLPQYLGQQIKSVISQQDAQGQEKTKFAQDLVTAALKSPTAVYVGPVDFRNANKPVPHIALMSKMGKERATAIADKINGLLKENPPGPGAPEIGAVVNGDYLLFSIAVTDLDKRFAGSTPADSLGGVEGFKSAMAQLGPNVKQSAAVIYVDAEAGLKLIDDGVSLLANPEIKRLWPIISDGAGLTGLRQIAWAGGFDGPNWADQTFIGLKERRTGLISFLNNGPLTDDTFKLIPRSATWAGVLRFDGPRLLADVRDVADKATPNGAQSVDTLLQRAYAWTGIDFKNDLLPSLGDQFVYYSTPDATGNSLRGITVVNKLKDADKATAALTSAESLVNLMMQQRDPNTTIQFRTQPLAAPLDKVNAHVLTLEGVTPAWAINNGVFYLSLSVAGLQTAVEAGTGARGTLLDNPQFVALRKKLGQETISSFDYVDGAKVAPEYYESMSQYLTFVQRLMPGADAAAPHYTLPPLDKLTPHLGPVLSVYWSDRDGFHAKTSEPFLYARSFNPAGAISMRLVQQLLARQLGLPQPGPAARPILP